ncbi:MAG: DUF1285 domain-containing protein [Alphaproteobacteria bacterium]|nr:DUF1285 domain-containing protein [Alphaproteobacteria bacterium]
MSGNPKIEKSDGAVQAERPLLFCGDLDIRITADGTWYHEGVAIRRSALVKLFASVLSRDEAGDYWLISPVERARIRVDDVPFLAVELKVEGEGRAQRLSFRTNLDDWVVAGQAHPIVVRPQPGGREPAPYLVVRDRLDARLTRAVYYELAERALDARLDGRASLGVHSDGAFFLLEAEPAA